MSANDPKRTGQQRAGGHLWDKQIAAYGNGPHVKSMTPKARKPARLKRSILLTRDVMACISKFEWARLQARTVS